MSIAGSTTGSEMNIARQVAINANGGDATGIAAPTDPSEIQQLSMSIRAWRELSKEIEELNAAVREKRKRKLALDEMILRIMKKNNIGALDLKSSGGRLLYQKKKTKATLNQKEMTRLMAEHLKSEDAAKKLVNYMTDHRGSKVKESLFFEKDS